MNDNDIKEKIQGFQNGFYKDHKETYEKLEGSQSPHTLLIGCSDSRILPDQILQSLPGEVFMLRNVANMMPPMEKMEDFPSPVSSLEYAVKALKVQNIVVQGHSNCGGCAAMSMDKEKLSELPQTLRWLELGPAPADESKYNLDNAQTPAQKMEWLNILQQLDHLRSYPWIKELEESGALTLLGWYYHIPSGKILQYGEEKGFTEIK